MDKNSHEDQTRSDFRHSRFVINSSLVIRHSSFVISTVAGFRS